MTLDNLFSEIDTASELYALKRMVRDRAFQLIENHFADNSKPICNKEEDYALALTNDDATDNYGDSAQIIGLSSEHCTVRNNETGDHSDLPYSSLDTDVLLQVVAHLEEVRNEVEA